MTTAHGQKIGVITATIIGMNAMIGSGIFTAPAAMATYVGPAGILAYIFVVFAVWCMALSFSRLAQLFPAEGSFYTYTKQWAGKLGGVISAGSYLIGLIIAMGLLAQVAGMYLNALLPQFSITTLGAATLVILVVLNMYGVIVSQTGQHILIATTVFPLIAITAICLWHGKISNLTPFAPYGFSHVFKATRIVIFGFFGFECAASLFSIVENPAKNVPRALAYSILGVGILYILFVASIILATPSSYFSDPRIPLSQVLMEVIPHHAWMVNLIHIAILSAIIGTIHSMIWSASAFLTTLVAQVSKNSFLERSPATAVTIIGAAIATTFLTFSNLNLFFSLTAIFIITAFILSMITLLGIKSEWQSGRNSITLCGILTASIILYFAGEGLIFEIAKIT
ncbi:MAG TPA: amino acid permease [Candidatus Bathyarchaeia archaeon]|nr:amino acid permease [Candidatus Bathyarchaeia archaeon]